jgi:plasmid maintenance system antidote protein VapI
MAKERRKIFESSYANAASEPISDVLRRAIEKSGSRYELSKKSGVAESVISRFVNRKATLNLETADRLARHVKVKVRTVDILRLRVSLKDMVKSWYRAKSRLHHPDHGGSSEGMALLVDCKEVLLERIDRLDFSDGSTVRELSDWEIKRRDKASGG